MRCRGGMCLLLLISSFALATTRAKTQSGSRKACLPVTTHSMQARKYFEQAMDDFEQYRLSAALRKLRLATKADPHFSQAYILVARISRDPEEQAPARDRAKEFASNSSAGEQLLVRWFSKAQEGDYVPAIAAMNDLLSKYPDDPRVGFLAGDWLNGQKRYDQAIVVLERVLKSDPNDAAALNDIGYAYAYSGDFQKAFAAMDRYVALQPDEPNSHDSYGELLRMAGKFDAALEQYRASIRLDPNFGSEAGVADTYALMGKEEDAREEYERAEVFAGSQYDKIEFEVRAAITWIRENNRKPAEKGLNEAARHAHSAGLGRLEAECYRLLALYESDPKNSLKRLQEADTALAEKHGSSQSDREDEQALILKTRAMRAAAAEDFKLASESVDRLESMAENSRSQVVQLSYHGACGAVLEAQGKHAEAITHLQEDSDDPISMRLLWNAYNNLGDTTNARALAEKLSSLNVPTEEQALVVPQFRANLVSQVSRR